ncbi:MAG: hypothetical protein PHN68_07695, partial [Prolixibacteraceae bacterium]|nr:hypothetical protein [Prolixibacteraceae bacterium]
MYKSSMNAGISGIIRRVFRKKIKLGFTLFLSGLVCLMFFGTTVSAQLTAGVAKVNITNPKVRGNLTDSMYVKALVMKSGNTSAVIITVDAVAIGGIGSVGNDYFTAVRSQVNEELGIEPQNVLINASHLHGAGYNVCEDVEARTLQAVMQARQNMVPVNAGAGSGYEDRITENHILKLKNGKGWAIRHANPLPPDEEIESVGPIDPEIGILRLDKKNGETLAIVYNFTGHPYQSITEETGGYPGFASKLIEKNISDGTIALFIQGFCGDVIPILYKDVHSVRDQEPLGTMLGLSALEAIRKIKPVKTGELNVISEVVKFPRKTDYVERIAAMETEQEELLRSLRGTSLNFKTFLPLYIKYNIFEEYPSYYSHRYLHEKDLGRNDLEKLDEENRRNIAKYLRNIHAMEKLARLQYNIDLAKDRKIENESAGESTMDVEIQAMKVGDFVLVTFPAEVSVQVGLNIKEKSPYSNTFVAGYTNGYIHYTPTADQFGSGAYQ